MSYGPGSDLLGIATTGVELQSISQSPTGSEAQALNEDGDVEASTVYGQWGTVSCTYKVRTDVAVTGPNLGSVAGDYYITKLSAKRSNTDTLEITAEGVLATLFEVAPDEYAVHDIFTTAYLTGGKGAIAAGITVSEGKVISSSIDASISLTPPLLDATGAVVDMDLYAGRVEATNEVQSASSVPAATAAGSWTLDGGSGSTSDDNTSYGTKTFTAFQNVTKYVAP